MQQHLLTYVYGFLFLLLIAGSAFRSMRRRSRRPSPRAAGKRTSRLTWRYLLRLGVTSVAAWAVAVTVADESAALVWVVLWVGLYWLWKLWDRRRGNDIPSPTHQPTTTEMVVPVSQALSGGGTRPLWRRAVRKTGTLLAGAFVLSMILVAVMLLCLGYYERQAKAERDKVQIGMTVDQVLPLVHGSMGIRTHAVLPDNVSADEGVHYATLAEHEDGSFGCSCGPDYQWRQLTHDEALALMKQKMSDGYEWRWRYTFINDTPQRFSFTVTFGRDGRVKQVTDVWGWD
jgi:hypothetical protein